MMKATTRQWKETVREWLANGTFDSMFPEVAALRGILQPEEYHAEGDAFTHTILTMDAVNDDADLRVFFGALLHDIGKSVTTVLDGGRWRSVGHAEAGAEMAQAVMERLGLQGSAREVSWLVKHHLFHFSWNLGNEVRLTRNQRRFMEHPLFPLLLEVCIADAEASYGRSNKGGRIRLIAELYEEEYGKERLKDEL
jgi:putative nucleotidyltransferase with HDIG domain